MWRFWDFAFPPMPPPFGLGRHLGLARQARLRTSSTRLNFDAPVRGPASRCVPAIGLAACSVAYRLWKLDRWRSRLADATPVALARWLASVIAASTRSTGDWCCSSIPIFLIAIAGGLDRGPSRRGGVGVLEYAGLAAMVLLSSRRSPPCARCSSDPMTNHGRLGDLHPEDRVDPYKFPF